MSTQSSEQRNRAFTLIELALLIAILAVLGLVLIPRLVTAKSRSQRVTCWDNLKQVGLSYRTWTLDSTDRYAQALEVTNGSSREWLESGQLFLHFRIMSNELSTAKILVCPADQEKQPSECFGQGFSNTNVSYLASQDAAEQFPQTILSGDRNLVFADHPAAPGTLSLTTNSLMPISWTKTVHRSVGLVGLADGSVQLVEDQKLPFIVQNQGFATNRLVLP